MDAVKRKVIEMASKEPSKFYPVSLLKSLGYKRQKCSKCNKFFWSINDRDVCGDTNCEGGYSFIGDPPTKRRLEFVEVWNDFKDFMSNRGYLPLRRFPVVARWRDDLDFNIASIIGFQPFVVRGEVPPPAEKVIIPQICLRFPDVGNVGYTGRHTTGFTMIGQHAFVPKDRYDQEGYFRDLFEWLVLSLGIPKEDLIIIEDAWAGGGNCGPCLEFFSRGLEIANQVYMFYEILSDGSLKELDIKVLDMGMGQERCCWISKGSLNGYEAAMPRVCKFLFEKSNFEPNYELYGKFMPYAGLLNLDEVEDIDRIWKDIANKLDVDRMTLKNEIEKIAGIYSIADHSRTLLYALADGALPSNVKGGYNLRLILRRALWFIDKFGWDIDLYEVIKIHADELSEQYPELKNELSFIKDILAYEKEKFLRHKERIKAKIDSLIRRKVVLDDDYFLKLYVSEGITPLEIKEAYEEAGLKLELPKNFYDRIVTFFQKREKKKDDLFSEFVKDLPETKLDIYSSKLESVAKVLKEFEVDGKKYIILDRTIFFPEMGGQASDHGSISGKKVKRVFKVGNVIVHEVED